MRRLQLKALGLSLELPQMSRCDDQSNEDLHARSMAYSGSVNIEDGHRMRWFFILTNLSDLSRLSGL